MHLYFCLVSQEIFTHHRYVLASRKLRDRITFLKPAVRRIGGGFCKKHLISSFSVTATVVLNFYRPLSSCSVLLFNDVEYRYDNRNALYIHFRFLKSY